MTLAYQKISIQLLVPSYTVLCDHPDLITSNHGSQVFYSPFGFPINGEYEDCGRLTNIIKDTNTNFIEEYFGITIEEIIEYVYGRHDNNLLIKNRDVLRNISLSYYNTEVLEFLQRESKYNEFYDSTDIWYDTIFNKLYRSEKSESCDRELFNTLLRGNLYIPTIIDHNFFVELSNIFLLQDEVKKQRNFLHNLNALNKYLVPSVYGGQTTNFSYLVEFNQSIQKILETK
jgi:hypothetical protein